MKKLKVGVVGAGGRMGKEIIAVIEQNPACDAFYPLLRNDKIDAKRAAQVDVWIDFTSPDALSDVLKMAAKNKTAVVCGTTGFSSKEKALLQKYSKQIPLLWSSNMSLGVAVLNEALKALSAISHFDFQVEEIHHNRKKDKPSGTRSRFRKIWKRRSVRNYQKL